MPGMLSVTPYRPSLGHMPERVRLRRDQKGQSLTELALILPVIILFLLGAADLGLALRAHTSLTQATQQAAQYLLNHPPTTCTANGSGDPCMEADAVVAGYLSANGFGGASAVVTFSRTAQSGSLLAHVNASYPFPVIMPIADQLNTGPLHHGSVTLGANANTLMGTPPPTSPTGMYTGGTSGHFTFNWTAPAPVPLSTGGSFGDSPTDYTYQIVFDDGSGDAPLPRGNSIALGTTTQTINCSSLPSQDQGYCNSVLNKPMPFRVETVQNNGLTYASNFVIGSS